MNLITAVHKIYLEKCWKRRVFLIGEDGEGEGRRDACFLSTPRNPRECIFSAIPRTSVCFWPSLWKILLVKESCMPVFSSLTCHSAAAFQSCQNSDYIWKKTRWIYQYLQLKSNLRRKLNNVVFIVARLKKDSKIPFLAVHRLVKLLSANVCGGMNLSWKSRFFFGYASVLLFRDNSNETARSQTYEFISIELPFCSSRSHKTLCSLSLRVLHTVLYDTNPQILC